MFAEILGRLCIFNAYTSCRHLASNSGGTGPSGLQFHRYECPRGYHGTREADLEQALFDLEDDLQGRGCRRTTGCVGLHRINMGEMCCSDTVTNCSRGSLSGGVGSHRTAYSSENSELVILISRNCVTLDEALDRGMINDRRRNDCPRSRQKGNRHYFEDALETAHAELEGTGLLAPCRSIFQVRMVCIDCNTMSRSDTIMRVGIIMQMGSNARETINIYQTCSKYVVEYPKWAF